MIKIPLKIFLLTLVIILPVLSISQFYIGYELTINYIAIITDSMHRTDKLKLLLTERKISYLHILNFVSFAISIFCLLKIDLISYKLIEVLSEIKKAVILRLNIFFNDKMALVLVAMPVIVVIYFAVNFPITNDEAATYLNYSSRSIFSSIAYYSHNNHILNSILTNITLKLPIAEIIALRLPSIVVYVTTLIIFWSYVREFLSRSIAYYSLGIFSTLYFSLYYGFVSRGYALKDLFFLLTVYAATKIILKPNRNILWIYLTIFSVFGFYAIPSFLYPYVAINIWLLFQPNRNLKKLITSGAVTTIVVLILYVPVFIVGGTKAIMPQTMGFLETIKLLPDFLYNSLEELTGTLPVFSLLIIISIFFTAKYNEIKKLFLILLLSLYILLALQSVIPFSRNLIYFNFLIAIFSGILIEKLITPFFSKIKNKWIFWVPIIPLQVMMIINFNIVINNRESLSLYAKKDIELVRNAKSYLTVSRTLDNYILYYFRTRDRNSFNVTYISPQFFDIMENDKSYEFILIDNEFLLPTNIKPFVQNSHYSIFKLQ